MRTRRGASQAVIEARDALDEKLAKTGSPCTSEPEWWDGEVGYDTQYAVSQCQDRCKAREECEIYALLAGEEFGVWGGLTAPQRERVLAAQARARRNENRRTQRAEQTGQVELDLAETRVSLYA